MKRAMSKPSSHRSTTVLASSPSVQTDRHMAIERKYKQKQPCKRLYTKEDVLISLCVLAILRENFKLMKLSYLIFLSCVLSISVFAQKSPKETKGKKEPIKVSNPDGMIKLISAPEKKFEGKIFLLNDWDGGDPDNQNVGEEINRNSKITENVVSLSDIPGHQPQKVKVNNLVLDAKVLAKASKQGKVAIAMGAHSRHALAWLTKLPANEYNYKNIIIVTHSNWNELDGREWYDRHKQPGDKPLGDTHGEDLRRGLYPNLAKISDLGVAIWEIPRTDSGAGGWGGKIESKSGEIRLKTLDISDMGLLHYLKTGITNATREQRNEYVSEELKKPVSLDKSNRDLITRYWKHNYGVPGEKEDYLKGGKSYEVK